MKWILFLGIFLGFCHALSGQNADTVRYRIEMRDGNVFTGTILERDSTQIVFLSDQLGRVTIPNDKMVVLEPITKGIGSMPYYNTQSARYFFSPNGYGLQRGEAYYQNVWVLYNQVSLGLTNHLSLGVGMVPLFLFGADATPVWMTPKVSVPVVEEKFQLGAGGFLGTILGESGTGFGILYGTGTIGSRAKNLTLGLGYGYADGQWADHPAISLSGMIQTGPRGFLISENYYLSAGGESLVLFSLGGRVLIRRVGLDFGGILPLSPDIDRFIMIPWLGITIPFYTKKKY
ncbi:MAG: hypothetical protein R2806_17885 [Saprospiraceae bacterium]